MFSLATSPVIEATAACQLPHPSGVNIQQIALPILAKILISISSSANILNPSSVNPKYVVNHTTIVERRIIVPAFLMNDQPRSHMLLSTEPTVGI